MTEPQDSTLTCTVSRDTLPSKCPNAAVAILRRSGETPVLLADVDLSGCVWTGHALCAGHLDRYEVRTVRSVTTLHENVVPRVVESERHLAHARYLGADAALAAASWLTMSEADAISILDGDGDPEVLDRYPKPNLSGEWADVATPDAVASEVGECPDDCDGIHVSSGPSAHHFSPEQVDEIATAWEEGRDGCWSDAVEAFAYRVVGNIPMALAIEASNEAYVASLRTAAGL